VNGRLPAVSDIRAGAGRLTSVPLNLLDELYLNLDRGAEPWTVHYEVQLATHLNAARLSDAIAAAARRHPLARARLAPWRFQDRSYEWEIAEELGEASADVIVADDDAAVAAARERAFSTSPSLATAPPFVITLVRRPDGDTLLLNLNHAAGDGVSAARLMLSIVRAYAGESDPIPPLDPFAVRDVGALAAAGSAAERSARRRAILTAAGRPFMSAARIAREGHDDRPAYGFEMLRLSRDESQTVFARQSSGTTVNDVLLGALALAIVRWNSEHGSRSGWVALSMPVNLRPSEWRNEIFSNFASWVTVWVKPAPHEYLAPVAARVAVTTRAIKRDKLGGLAVDLLRMPGTLMIAGKRWLQYAKTVTNEVVVDTASLSNLGITERMPSPFDGAGVSVWFSPPSQMPLGIGIGAVTFAEQLHVTVRYRHTQFDAPAARRFTELFRDVLLDERQQCNSSSFSAR
jgi:NRPS condensation-like uncharacterized protein